MTAFWAAGDRGKPAANTAAMAQTSAQLVHLRLREEIVSMMRRPGDVINEKEIASENNVSRTPVREALLRLADEKLIEIVPKSGTIVARIPVAILPEIIVARTALEVVTVRAAAERARTSEIVSLRAIIEHQRETILAGDRDGFHATDELLHRAIAEAAGYPAFWPMILQIKVQLDRYRRLTLPQPHRMERGFAEHEEIIEAIARRDADTAGRAMSHHLDGLGDSLAEIADLNPNYFTGDIAEFVAAWKQRPPIES